MRFKTRKSREGDDSFYHTMIGWIWGYKRGYSNQQIYLALEFYSPDIQERISMGHLWCEAKLVFSGNGFNAFEYDF